ncbi:hypothetical protein K7432_016967 [Basidiobolus ranarum]|uniref:Uncharacterized protein n=1 Tax=Basidiobolus ranarum TaxID=34480 RepID=A0ABR2VLQ1_9FUNG
MFDTSRLLSYLSKPIELPNSLWPDIDLAPNEPQPQPLDNSTNLEDSRVLQTSGPTTPTPNCTKLQLFSTMTEEIDTSFELLTCNYLVSSPTSSLCSKDVQPNTFSPTPSSRASNSDRIKLKSSSSNPHLRTSNQFNGRRPLYPAASSISLISPSSAVQKNGSDSSTFPSFARNKKHSSAL